ncbi:hypothetical protein [Streptosporangium fragile]|uniref:hypothetical protein n=1 Tax=Streptosporangium fragile TaxID=46186 RepID=UPI0031E5A127
MTRLLTVLGTVLSLLAVPAPASAAAPAGPRVPAGVTAGYVVFDRQTGKVTAHHDARRRFRSASVVKILIAIDHLESHRAVPESDLALLKVMLRVSDDDAATSFWNRGGQGRIIQRMARRLQLTDTAPPPADKPGFWGYTSLSALDVVKTYRYLLDRAEPRVATLVLGHLRKAGQCGSDGFDQYFGIPRAVRGPWAVKQGWSGYGSTPPVRCRPAASPAAAAPDPRGTAASSPGAAPATGAGKAAAAAGAVGAARPDGSEAAAAGGRTTSPTAAGAAPVSAGAGPVPDLGRPVLHTTGLVGPGERRIMVLLTAYPAGTSWQRSTAQMTRLAREVYLSGTS